jgi:hypothetical protein
MQTSSFRETLICLLFSCFYPNKHRKVWAIYVAKTCGILRLGRRGKKGSPIKCNRGPALKVAKLHRQLRRTEGSTNRVLQLARSLLFSLSGGRLAQPGSTRVLDTEIARTFNGFLVYMCPKQHIK